MEMIKQGITAHSPDGCSTGEDVLKFFDQHPRMHYQIKDGKAIYTTTIERGSKGDEVKMGLLHTRIKQVATKSNITYNEAFTIVRLENPSLFSEAFEGRDFREETVILYQYDIYEVDIDVLNINKIFDCDGWSMIETKDGKVHLVQYWGHDIAIMLLKSANIGWQDVGF